MTTIKPVIRAVTDADLESIIALDALVTGQSRRGFYAKRFAAMQEQPKAFVWLAASVDGKLAGFISSYILDGEFGGKAPIAVLDSINIASDKRRHGIAHLLMDALELELKSRQIKELRTEANWSATELTQFFATNGFQLAPNVVLESNVAASY